MDRSNNFLKEILFLFLFRISNKYKQCIGYYYRHTTQSSHTELMGPIQQGSREGKIIHHPPRVKQRWSTPLCAVLMLGLSPSLSPLPLLFTFCSFTFLIFPPTPLYFFFFPLHFPLQILSSFSLFFSFNSIFDKSYCNVHFSFFIVPFNIKNTDINTTETRRILKKRSCGCKTFFINH